MEAMVGLPFIFLTVPNLKIRKPSWLVKPSPMLVFTLALFSYFLVTAEYAATQMFKVKLVAVATTAVGSLLLLAAVRETWRIWVGYVMGVIYDVIVEPPGVGSTVDERGVSRPVAFMPYRVNGQYILEGLASSFLFTFGGLGFIILYRSNNAPTLYKQHTTIGYYMMTAIGFLLVLVSVLTTHIFMKMKLPGYYLHP